MAESTPRLSDAVIAEIVRRVSELPDRTSPDDWPEAMLVTGDELQQVITAVLAEDAQHDAQQIATLQAQRDEAQRYRDRSEQLFGLLQQLFGFDAVGDDPTDVFTLAEEELRAYARWRAIGAEHAITEPDTLKHRLEDWERWNAERKDGTP